MRLEPVAPFTTEIARLSVSIQAAHSHVNKLQEELERLNTCKKELIECKNAFEQNDSLCRKPELGSKTWHGNLADGFNAIRKKKVQSNYRELLNHQLHHALEQVKNRIQTVQMDIDLTLYSISSQQLQLSELKEQQRKECRL
ncbi:DUF5082 family protein [Fictibacillus sp. Mic-4]|uniref:YwqH-like family protein n=1 Tax=Fictibacillus TaxID=1329200 RepID=UPI00041BAD6F|nr:DUF5082 family protein [Fictibacillus gelatini]